MPEGISIYRCDNCGSRERRTQLGKGGSVCPHCNAFTQAVEWGEAGPAPAPGPTPVVFVGKAAKLRRPRPPPTSVPSSGKKTSR